MEALASKAASHALSVGTGTIVPPAGGWTTCGAGAVYRHLELALTVPESCAGNLLHSLSGLHTGRMEFPVGTRVIHQYAIAA
jgi:hypothetical protein